MHGLLNLGGCHGNRFNYMIIMFRLILINAHAICLLPLRGRNIHESVSVTMGTKVNFSLFQAFLVFF